VIERHALVPGYVLHLQPYRESSALVNLFTAQHGRVALVARGVRRSRSPVRALLQPFTPLLLSWSSRGDLGTLGSVERAMASKPLTGTGLLSGMYLNELLMRLTQRHEPLPELFRIYGHTLAALAEEGVASDRAGIEPILRTFEVCLLEALGYGLALLHEAGSGLPVEAGKRYLYRPQFGPVSAGVDAYPGSSVPVSGSTLLALAGQVQWNSSSRAEAKRVMRAEIDAHLGNRPLKSRALFRHGERSR
jgi:DNA repair protein RecO (recombination protein O)